MFLRAVDLFAPVFQSARDKTVRIKRIEGEGEGEGEEEGRERADEGR